MTAALSRAAYVDLLSLARRHARGGVEAEDLLQDALAVALEAGRGLSGQNRAWLGGVMRNLALMSLRGTARRRRRELDAAAPAAVEAAEDVVPPALAGLAPSLRIVALLALGGHNRAEIRSLLRISDEALRQRIAVLRRGMKQAGSGMPAGFPALRGGLAFGAIRRALLPTTRRCLADFASHDPDGHLLAFRMRPAAHEIRPGGNWRGQAK